MCELASDCEWVGGGEKERERGRERELIECANKKTLRVVMKKDNFRHVLYVVCFLVGNSPASEFYMPTFRNTLSVPSS